MTCEWCGDPVPRAGRRYCSSVCIGEAVHENDVKFPRNAVKRLYVFEGLSSPAIARRFGVTPAAIRRALHKMGVEMRSKTSLRICRTPGCGREAFKRFNRSRKCLAGGLCYECLKTRWTARNRKKAA